MRLRNLRDVLWKNTWSEGEYAEEKECSVWDELPWFCSPNRHLLR